MRYLALDLGDKRTGIALGDEETRLASPVAVVDVDRRRLGEDGFVRAIAALVVRHLGSGPRDVGEIVIGLPLNMDGTEGPGSRRARAVADRLAAATGRRVHLVDERLTSAEADWSMAGSGLTHGQKKQRRDAIAAAAILGSFLATRGDSAPGTQDG